MTQKVALITGVSSGIGKATTLHFAKNNVHVVGVARRADRLQELETQINSLPEPHGKFLPIPASVTDAKAMQQAVEQTLEYFGRLDILIANAGVGHRGSFIDSEWDGLETLLRTNIDGVAHSIRAAVPAMRKSGGGHIITISSVASQLTLPYAASYAASKAFVTSIAHSLRLELEDENIHVSDIVIGRIETEFNANRLGEGPREASSIPAIKPEDVAEAIFRTVRHPRKTIFLRWMDRLTLWANHFIPDRIGRIAKKQYQ